MLPANISFYIHVCFDFINGACETARKSELNTINYATSNRLHIDSTATTLSIRFLHGAM